jgi:insulin-like growth factor 2 receptor
VGFVAETSQCFYTFVVRTALACASQSEFIECIAEDPDHKHQYDLSSLRRKTANWRLTATTQDIEINVCAPLVRTGLVDSIKPCSPGSAACVLKSTNPSRAMGVPTAPAFDDGRLVLHYTASAGSGETIINFKCGATIGSPQFVGLQGGRILIVEWVTSAACPVGATPLGDNCKVRDPDTGYIVDLSGLQSDTPIKATNTLEPSIEFYISACGKTGRLECGGQEGICAVASGKGTSYGRFSDEIQLIEGVPTLFYSNGDACKNETGGFYRSLVEFECVNEASAEGVVVERFTPCGAVFVWRTQKACFGDATEDECVTSDPVTGTEYDLSILSDPKRNWLAVFDLGGDNKGVFEINVCQPVSGDQCENAGICQRTQDDDYSAGGVAYPQFDAQTGEVFLLYEGGKPCGAKARKSRIDFRCNHERGVGVPEFLREENCEYYFVWESSAACPIRQASGCSVMDPMSNAVYNLTGLIKGDGYAVSGTIDGDKYDFTLAVCEPLTKKCNEDDESGACQEKVGETRVHSMGKASLSPVINGGKLQLVYNHGEPCKLGQTLQRRTIITFVCDETTSADIEFVDETSDCVYEFTWRSTFACGYKYQAVDCFLAGKDGSVCSSVGRAGKALRHFVPF